MGGAVDAREFGVADASVAFGGGDGAVTKELLDHADVHPGIEQVGGNAVAQDVGGTGTELDSIGGAVERQIDPRGAGGQTEAEAGGVEQLAQRATEQVVAVFQRV